MLPRLLSTISGTRSFNTADFSHGDVPTDWSGTGRDSAETHMHAHDVECGIDGRRFMSNEEKAHREMVEKMEGSTDSSLSSSPPPIRK